MKLKHFYWMAAVVVLVALGAYFSARSANYYSRFPGDKGKAYETYETDNTYFKVKITASEEVGIFTAGAFFTFESAPVDSNDWRTFWDYRADDPVSIPRERFHFVNDQTAYFYGYGHFLTTVDAGRSWSHWKPILPDSEGRTHHWGIREASIEADGKGTMKLERYDEQSNQRISAEVFTENFGRNWSPIVLR
jgi:hypothetical protein